ncbi:acetoacetyl-CoA synthetase [Gemmobacter caeni]|uniref:Acetoacetyl-CoA synthetase n=1 Tax=Gemmobacter caeni TaxID=589035 RepID=A0A2T6B9F1_9RHOB|nr:acetoacetate--CoA ligase [Gemmobacter caeni]PTX52683.1 acetoacetyl-CoA synthetase [Gemmobacter caeni]TWI94862.1 acetoacetyl-CoA synthetase [Gemmobacter caeni]
MTDDEPLWTPSSEALKDAPLGAFMAAASAVSGRAIPDYDALHAWSVEDLPAFWALIWDWCGIVGDRGPRTLIDGDRMPGARFFPDARLNFAENLLKQSGDGDALVFRGEDKVARRLSWDELRDLVSRMQQLFRARGIKAGDRVAAMMPNMPETVAAMLAVTSLGAVWSSCSPDFGEQGVLDRFGQIEPSLFIAPDGYWYAGKRIDVADKIAAVVARIPSIRAAFIIDYLGEAERVAAHSDKAETLSVALASFEATDIFFEQLPFDHPLYILYSSGTTGVPKCIVHSAGGTLIQHLKEHRLHAGLREGDRFFYFTTCGWMMWNWLVTGLASGAVLLLYDGSPFYPDGDVIFSFAQDEKMSYFGTSAKFIDSVRKGGLRPIETHDLSTVRVISSTGSPLAPENFRFVYDAIKRDVHLASISGGTDIVSCFVLGIPTKPVYGGQIQGPGLGMDIGVFDDDGRSLNSGKGELVCKRPFPSMPLMFWNDPDGTKYRAAYFERYRNIWCQGDFAQWTDHGGIMIHGRSDTTLNPGGVRIGTAEIYNQIERLDEILDSICIGQEWDGDVRVILFVVLKPGIVLDELLEKTIRRIIRTGASPRHVPAKIISVSSVPRTKSGKLAEIAVRDVVHGRAVKNQEALSNPEVLELYRNLKNLLE